MVELLAWCFAGSCLPIAGVSFFQNCHAGFFFVGSLLPVPPPSASIWSAGSGSSPMGMGELFRVSQLSSNDCACTMEASDRE